MDIGLSNDITLNSKESYRENLIKLRKEIILKNEKSDDIFENIKKIIEENNFSNISCYISFENEVNTSNFIFYCLKNNLNIYVPTVDTDTNNDLLILQKIHTFSPLESECVFENVEYDETININDLIDVCIVPGVSFDYNKDRLGFGKGYYDKFLSSLNPNTLKIGVCFDEQLVKKLPLEPHDVRMDLVITDKQILK